MSHFVQLLFLGALWGASFLFMRMAVGAFGPILLIQWRVFIAAFFLLAVITLTGKHQHWRKALATDWRTFFLVAVLNLSLPFVCFAYGAKFLSASVLAIINATAPFFSALFASFFLSSPMSKPQWTGLTLGFIGVIMVVAQGLGIKAEGWWLAIAITLLAPMCYGLSTTYLRHRPVSATPLQISLFTLCMASAQLLPFSLIFPEHAPISALHWGAVLGLGILCTGLAYIIFYGLFEKIGATRTLTVTFLVPLFATLWGAVFLHEPVTLSLIMGGVLILLGVAVTNHVIKWPKKLMG